MSGTVSTRWYFTDWMSDESVRACSFAARGLWMDLLCIAGSNRGKEYGFVLIAGRVPDAAQLARRLGSTPDEVEKLLHELLDNRVCNQDRRGAIYCRRMVRAEKYRGNGRAGGNPNLLKNKKNKKPVGPPVPEPEPEPVRSPPLGGSARPVQPELDVGLPPNNPPPKKSSESLSRKTLLPPDWRPSVRDLEYAKEHGFPQNRAEQMAEAFRDHHTANGNRLVWDAAWRMWVRNEVKFQQRNDRRRTGGGSGNAFAELHMELRESQQQETFDGHHTDDAQQNFLGALPAPQSRR